MFVIQKFSNIDNDHHHYHFITTTTTIQEREESQLVCVFPGFTDQLCWSRADIEKTPFLCFCPPGQWFKHKLNNKLPLPSQVNNTLSSRLRFFSQHYTSEVWLLLATPFATFPSTGGKTASNLSTMDCQEDGGAQASSNSDPTSASQEPKKRKRPTYGLELDKETQRIKTTLTCRKCGLSNLISDKLEAEVKQATIDTIRTLVPKVTVGYCSHHIPFSRIPPSPAHRGESRTTTISQPVLCCHCRSTCRQCKQPQPESPEPENCAQETDRESRNIPQ